MNKYPGLFKTIVGAICIAATSIPPVWSDVQTTSTQAKKSIASRLVSVPKSIAGFCAGVVIGTPICFIRKLPEEVNKGTHGLADSIASDTNNKFLLVSSGVLWLPLASIVTALEAPGYAFRDAYMAEKPFSKEQFSLEELDSPNKK